jgi:ABC-2 type transport system permease protein
VVAGKFLARAGIVLAGILIAFVVGTAVSLAIYRTVPVRVAALTALLTCLLGVAFVGVAVGVSAAVASRARAGALAIGFFVVTVVLWSPLLLAAQFLLRLPFDQAQQPEWFLFLKAFPPSNAFGRLYNSVVGSLLPGGPPPGEAIYLSDAAMVALLVLWTVVPLALGYWQFERTDL